MRTEYISRVGFRKFDLHIDRIDPRRGYVPDNVQVLTAHDNIVKGNKERHLSRQRLAPQEETQPHEDENCPF